jgi:hypothetical protein
MGVLRLTSGGGPNGPGNNTRVHQDQTPKNLMIVISFSSHDLQFNETSFSLLTVFVL